MLLSIYRVYITFNTIHVYTRHIFYKSGRSRYTFGSDREDPQIMNSAGKFYPVVKSMYL